MFSLFTVIGDRRKYLTALCNIDLEQAEKLATKRNISFNSATDLLDHKKFLALIQERVDKLNKRLAKFETIKYFKIIKHTFSQETGELTPTQKMKRRVIYEKFSNEIDSLYA